MASFPPATQSSPTPQPVATTSDISSMTNIKDNTADKSVSETFTTASGNVPTTIKLGNTGLSADAIELDDAESRRVARSPFGYYGYGFYPRYGYYRPYYYPYSYYGESFIGTL